MERVISFFFWRGGRESGSVGLRRKELQVKHGLGAPSTHHKPKCRLTLLQSPPIPRSVIVWEQGRGPAL